MRARHIVDTEDWSLRSRWPAEPPDGSFDEGSPAASRHRFFYELTDSFAALRDGEGGPARTFVASHDAPASEAERLQLLQLRGLLAIDEGRGEEGLELLSTAAEAEDALPLAFGPPSMVKPTFELLGEELVRAGRQTDAGQAYRRAAERTPGRPLAHGPTD